MNVFFELSEAAKSTGEVGYPGRYFAAYDVKTSDQVPIKYLSLMQFSERAWAEEENGIRFMKNRHQDIRVAKVDMKEFFWIKLKSINV